MALACRAPETPAPEELTQDPGEQNGRHHDVLSRNLHRVAARLDSFLSDERSLAEENRTWISLRAEGSLDQREGNDSELRLDGRLVLPEFEDHLQIAFGEDPDPVRLGTQPPPASTAEPTREPDLGLQFLLRRTKRNHVRLDGGVRFEDFEPDPYLGLRWRHVVPLGEWQARLTERLRGYVDAGLDSRTTLDFERLVGDIRFFRATTRARWREDEAGWEYGQRFQLFQRADELRIVTFEWDNAFVTAPVDRLDEVAARVRVAHRFDRGRYLLEIVPQIAWRDAADYEPSAGLTVTFEISVGREDPR